MNSAVFVSQNPEPQNTVAPMLMARGVEKFIQTAHMRFNALMSMFSVVKSCRF